MKSVRVGLCSQTQNQNGNFYEHQEVGAKSLPPRINIGALSRKTDEITDVRGATLSERVKKRRNIQPSLQNRVTASTYEANPAYRRESDTCSTSIVNLSRVPAKKLKNSLRQSREANENDRHPSSNIEEPDFDTLSKLSFYDDDSTSNRSSNPAKDGHDGDNLSANESAFSVKEVAVVIQMNDTEMPHETAEDRTSIEDLHLEATIATNEKTKKHKGKGKGKVEHTFDGIDYKSLLPLELLELAEIIESQKSPTKSRVKWDWDYIESKASKRLKNFLEIKKKSPYFRITTMKIVVGEEMKQSFLAYREHIKGGECTKRKLKQVSPICSGSRKKIPRRQKKIVQPAANTPDGLSKECIQLAELLAKAKRSGQTWAYVESMASEKLKTYIQTKAKATNFLIDPVRSLVPSKHLSDFQEYTAWCFDQYLDTNEGQDNYRNKQNDDDLGKRFALERRDRIKAFAKALRAEVHSFESKELAVWNTFLPKREN